MTPAAALRAAAPAPPLDHAPLLERAFAFEPRELEARLDVEGELPEFVRGRYYLNGPGRNARGGVRYRHWLDGDGMVSGLFFSSTGVRFVHRFVRGAKLQEEEAAGRALYRAFGTAFPGDRLLRGIALASPLNVSVYPFAGKLLAFGEQGLPWELDPETLESRGEMTFGGRLNGVSPFSAHPHFDPESGEMWSFGVSFSPRRPQLQLYRFDPGGALLTRSRLALDAPRSVHDFALAPRHAVFYLSPYLLDVAALSGGATLLDALAWRPELGSKLLIVDRESGAAAAEVAIGNRYCLHLIGCFERRGRLTVDVVELERPVYDQYCVPELFPAARWARPVRYEVDVERRRVTSERDLGVRAMCDFPACDPRRAGREYHDFWMLAISHSELPGRKFFDRLVRCDWRRPGVADLHRADAGCFLGGEPAFVPDPAGERRGAVIVQQFDAAANASSFLVFDALDLARGPLARLPVPAPIRLGFHAVFEPGGKS